MKFLTQRKINGEHFVYASEDQERGTAYGWYKLVPVETPEEQVDVVRDIPYDFCENCLNEVETEDDVCKYGDFVLCCRECVEEFKNLLAQYDYHSNSREGLFEHFEEQDARRVREAKS